MSFLDFITSLPQNATFERALKTFVEATAAQAALYTTIVPNSPGVKTGAAVSVGATVLSIVWNGLLAWAAAAKNAKLLAFTKAVEDAVTARLAVQPVVGTVIVSPPVEHSTPAGA